MKIESERPTRYSAFQLVFYTFAMTIDRQTLLEKRWLASMALSLVFTVYAVSILSMFQAAGFEVIEQIGRLWPWSSENTRSFKNVGTIFVILFGLPAMVFWLRIGATVSGDLDLERRPSTLVRGLFMSWFFANIFAVAYINLGLGLPAVAVAVQTAGFIMLVVWLRWWPVMFR